MKPRIEVQFNCSSVWHFWFGNFQPVKGEFYLNHNRTGLLLALQALELPQGSCVGMMVYNCETVMAAIRQAGYRVVFLDVNDDFRLDLDDLKRKQSILAAIVVTHLFGIPNDMEQIREIMAERPLIEDCAHAWGSHFQDGVSCGDKGDMASWSVGQGKIPAIGDGGILKVNNESNLNSVRKLYDLLPDCSFADNLRLVLRLRLLHWLYKPFVYGCVTWKIKQKSKHPVTGCINAARMSSGILRLLSRKRSDISSVVALHQQTQSAWFQTLSCDSRVKLPNNDLLSLSNGFMLPALSEERETIMAYYREKGIELGRHFFQCIDWAKEFGYQEGNCPNAEKIRDTIVVFPTYYKL